MIREARRDDFVGLMALYAQLNPDDPVLDDGADAAAFERILAADHLHLFVLDPGDGLILATCYLNLIPNITRRASPYAIIENVVTDRDHRNRGFGKDIIRHALQFAWDNGCYKVMLQTGSRRASTHAFYRACGFRDDEKFAFLARPPSALD